MMMSWNLYLLIYNRWYFHRAVAGKGDNAWGFGQSMPLIILILPAVTILDAVFGTFRVVSVFRVIRQHYPSYPV